MHRGAYDRGGKQIGARRTRRLRCCDRDDLGKASGFVPTGSPTAILKNSHTTEDFAAALVTVYRGAAWDTAGRSSLF